MTADNQKTTKPKREADIESLMRSLGFTREEAERVVDQVHADSVAGVR